MSENLVRNIQKRVRLFLVSQVGAVTVDWVVLTALVVGLAAAAFAGVNGGVASLTAQLAAYLQSLII